MNPTAVVLDTVSKRFGRDVIAVNAVSLDIPAGSLVTLLGPSGCGKTTTLRMIAGLDYATSGKIFIDGEDVTKLPANLRDVTMVFQSYALFPHMNVFDNVAYGLKVARLKADLTRSKVEDILETVGLSGLSQRAIRALSGGQQQRVALARALVMQPKVLLFDEPLSNLDAKLRKRVRSEIRELQQSLGLTSIYVTHDQEEALAISDTVVVMNQGNVEQIGSPHELYTKPANRFVADFIGSASFLKGHYDGKRLDIGGYQLDYQQDISQGEVIAMLRPEAVTFSPDDGGLEATLIDSAYLGSMTDYLFDSPVGQINAHMFGEGLSLYHKGDKVHLAFKQTGLYLLKL